MNSFSRFSGRSIYIFSRFGAEFDARQKKTKKQLLIYSFFKVPDQRFSQLLHVVRSVIISQLTCGIEIAIKSSLFIIIVQNLYSCEQYCFVRSLTTVSRHADYFSEMHTIIDASPQNSNQLSLIIRAHVTILKREVDQVNHLQLHASSPNKKTLRASVQTSESSGISLRIIITYYRQLRP